MTTTQNILTKSVKFRLKAFTLLESLLTLSIVSFLAIGLSSNVSQTFQSVQENLFLLSFEQLYKDSQRLSAARQEPIDLILSDGRITNGYETIQVPRQVSVGENRQVTFDEGGGNSSLSKVTFTLPDKEVTYQLYLGSGKYQKKTR